MNTQLAEQFMAKAGTNDALNHLYLCPRQLASALLIQ